MTKLWKIGFEKKNPGDKDFVGGVSVVSTEQVGQIAFKCGARLSPRGCFAWAGGAGHSFMWLLPRGEYA